MIRFRPKHVRTRLTIWYVSMLGALLLVCLAGTSLMFFWQLRTQLGHYAIQELEAVEGLLYFQPNGRLDLRQDYHNHVESRHVLVWLLEVRAPDGMVLYRNERLGHRSLGGDPYPGEGVGGYSVRTARISDGTVVRMASRSHAVDGRPTVIRLAYEEKPLWGHLKELWMASLLFLPIALAVAGYAGYLLARQALAPLGEMARRAGKITSERLSERLPVDNPEDEIGQLAQVFNQTLGRLEQAFVQLRRFTADASHELRTPLAAMRSVGEVGLQKEASPEEYRDVIGSMLEEVNRLNRLVDSLLVLSRADAGAIQFHTAAFPVLEVARECAMLLQVLVDEKRQKLVVEGDADARVEADRLFLRQALVNILHNAVRYSPVGSRISIRVRQEAGDVVLEVADNGPGITPEHAGKVFDRFYRIDQSRSREAGGAGLGLSIAQWAVEEHGGTIALDSHPGAGSTFQIRLPAKPMAITA